MQKMGILFLKYFPLQEEIKEGGEGEEEGRKEETDHPHSILPLAFCSA